MVDRDNLEEGKEYRVIANTGGHEFEIGEIVRFMYDDGDDDIQLACQYLDGHDYWYMNPEELEEIK